MSFGCKNKKETFMRSTRDCVMSLIPSTQSFYRQLKNDEEQPMKKPAHPSVYMLDVQNLKHRVGSPPFCIRTACSFHIGTASSAAYHSI